MVEHKLSPSHQHWLHQVWKKMFSSTIWWHCCGKLFLIIILLSPMMLWGDYSVNVLWCNWTLFCVLAGGIANFIIYLWLLLYCDWCNCHWARCFEAHFYLFCGSWCYRTKGGYQGVTRALTLWGCYLSFISGDLINTSSHICGSRYLPIFLFRDGSLALISIASLMDLVMLWSSLPTVLKFSKERSWLVVLWWSWMSEGALMCPLNISAKVLSDSSTHSSSKSTLPHLYL